MKKLLIPLLFLCNGLFGQIYLELAQDTSLSFDEIVQQTETYFDTKGRGKHTGYKQFKRWEYWTRRSLGPNNRIITNDQIRKETSRFSDNHGPRRSMTGSWTDMGPSSANNTSTWSSHIGRISAIGLDVTNSSHYIVGSPTGGVWKTTDNGSTWAPIFDNEAAMNVYSLAISPTNAQHYYCGTYGLGILKSVDGGATWATATGVGTNTLINRIIIDPTNSNTLLAVSQWGNVYRSTNQGDNWNSVLSSNDDLYDLEFKPNDSNTIYASGDGNMYKSTDNGASFSTLSGPWANDEPMMMAVTPDDNDYLYILQSDGGGFGALYLSTDAGSTFSTQSDDSSGNNNIMGYNLGQTGGQAPRDMDVVVSPTDKTEVHVAGVMTFKSTNSGVTWNQTTHWVISNSLPFIHADCDIMFYQGNDIYFGTDGGIFISSDGGSTFSDKTTGLGIRQFYRIGVSETEIDRVSGGSQDNGTGTIESGTWTDWVGADGMETFIAKHDEDIIYASIQFGGLYKTVNGGNSLASINNPPGGDGDWVTPLEEDPTTNNVLYQGKNQLYKSTNGGSTWSSISSFNPSNSNDDNLVEVTLAPSNNQVIYAAYRHQIFKTNNGGTTWTDVSPSYSFTNVNYINVHPTDDQKALVVLSGVNEKVIETTDQGTTWTDITASLPSVGAECAIYEGTSADGIYVAMNPGIYYKNNNNTTWTSYMTALPNVRVAELEIRNNFIYAGSYGRGLWKNDLSVNLSCSINSIADLGVIECDNSTGTYTRVLEVDYSGPPTTGTLDINGTSFPILGSPQNIQLTNQPLDGNSVDVTISFSADPNCDLTRNNVYTNPTTCPCIIDGANELILTCEGYSTGTINDDTFTFSIDPVGSNIGTIYSVTGDVTAANVSYGSPLVFDNGGAGYLITSGNKNFTITDDGDPTCSLAVTVIAPTTCSTNYTCSTANVIASTGTHSAIGPGQGNGGSNSDRNANWFSYVPPSDGLLSVNSCLKGVDTRLFIHDGTCTNLNQVADSDDDCLMVSGGSDAYASEIEDLCVIGGTTYYIEWDDRWSSSAFDFEVLFTSNTYYADADGDGYGDDANSLAACTQPTGYVSDNSDCDDSDPAINPGAIEICDGIDNDCDNMIDEGLTVTTYYADTDGDSYGDNSSTLDACVQPTGYVTDNTDCDDNNAAINPGATEICDGIDNNCDNMIDEGLAFVTYYADTDSDGYGDNSSSVSDCTQPAGYVTDNTDCNDSNAAINPGASEICDGIDNNCDNQVDEGCAPNYCDDVYLVINTVSQDIYRAEINITSDAVVDNTNTVLFTAGTDIDLIAPFEVILGTEFEAKIMPCLPPPAPGGDPEFYDIKNLEEMEEYFNSDSHNKKQFLIELIGSDGNTTYSKSGNYEIIKTVRQKIESLKNKNILIRFRFLSN